MDYRVYRKKKPIRLRIYFKHDSLGGSSHGLDQAIHSMLMIHPTTECLYTIHALENENKLILLDKMLCWFCIADLYERNAQNVLSKGERGR